MKEIWKDIPGYEGLYKVSNLGNVYGLKRKKLLSPCVLKTGHKIVSLSKNGLVTKYLLHRIVAQVFIPNPNNKPYVCHKISIANGGDNSVNNLYWGTQKDNISDCINEKKHSSVTGGNYPMKPILKLDIKTEEIISEYKSATEAAKAINGDIGLIGKVCQGKRKTAYGYKWIYKKGD